MPKTSRITYILLWGKAVMSFASGVFCLWQHPPFCGHCNKVPYILTAPFMQSLQPGCCPSFARLRVAGGCRARELLSYDSLHRPFAASGTCKTAFNPSGTLLQAPRPHSRRLAATHRYQLLYTGSFLSEFLKKAFLIGGSNPPPNPCTFIPSA